MKPIRTIVILLAALVLAVSCIDSHPKTPILNTTDQNITAEEFVYGGHQWIAFFYHFDTRQLFEVKHNPDCPCHKAADNAQDEKEPGTAITSGPNEFNKLLRAPGVN